MVAISAGFINDRCGEILYFSTSVMLRNLKFLHKTCDKYEVWWWQMIMIIDLEDERLLGLDKLSLIEELRRCCCRRSFSPHLHLASFSSPFDNCQCIQVILSPSAFSALPFARSLRLFLLELVRDWDSTLTVCKQIVLITFSRFKSSVP